MNAAEHRELLRISRIVKVFDNGVVGLAGMDLTVRPGEVHAVIGANGAGKSTLIKCCAGSLAADSGTIETPLGSARFPITSSTARRLGLTFVHQDRALVPGLSLVENIACGGYRADLRRGWSIDWRNERALVRKELAALGVDADPRTLVGDLPASERTIGAIARSLRHVSGTERSVIVLDEPTASLSQEVADRVLTAVRALARSGHGVILVSHYLDQVRKFSDRVTVLREGSVYRRFDDARVSERELAEAMFGITSAETGAVKVGVRPALPPSGTIGLHVAGLSGGDVRGIELDVEPGQIIGTTGLEGSGYDDVCYLIAGAIRASGGLIQTAKGTLDATRTSLRSRGAAGIAFIPGDRVAQGGWQNLTVAENFVQPRLRLLRRRGLLRSRHLINDARTKLDRYGVVPKDPQITLRYLSGGNQQKMLVAKWLAVGPRVLVVHEPFLGLDVASRTRLITFLQEAAESGVAVLVASQDPRELLDLCDRIAVFRQGRIVANLDSSGGVSAEDVVVASLSAVSAEAVNR